MIHPGDSLPDLDPSPPDPPPHCDDCLAFLVDGECPVCAEAEEYAKPEPLDADDANDRAREARAERKREGL